MAMQISAEHCTHLHLKILSYKNMYEIWTFNIKCRVIYSFESLPKTVGRVDIAKATLCSRQLPSIQK